MPLKRDASIESIIERSGVGGIRGGEGILNGVIGRRRGGANEINACERILVERSGDCGVIVKREMKGCTNVSREEEKKAVSFEIGAILWSVSGFWRI